MSAISVAPTRRGWLTLLAGLLLAACRAASLPPPELPLTPTPDAPFRSQPPQVTASPLLRAPDVRELVLENGLTVWVVERPQLPLLSVMFAGRSARDDLVKDRQGLAALTLTVLRKSVRSDTRTDDEQEDELGRSWQAFTSSGGSAFGIHGGASDAADSVARLANALINPKIDAQLTKRAWGLLQGSLSRRSLSIQDRLRRATAIELYGDAHPIAWAISEDYERIGSFTDQDVRRFHETHYGPQDSALIFVGAITAEQAFTLARGAFGGWKSARVQAVSAGSAPALRNGARLIRAFQSESDPAFVSVALPCVPLGNPDEVQLDMIAALLDRVQRSKFAQELRHDSALSYGWEVGCRQRIDSGIFSISTAVEVGRVKEVLDVILGQIERVARAELSEDDLHAAQTAYLGNFANRLSSTVDLTRTLASGYLIGRPKEDYATLETRVRSVKLASFREIGRRHFHGSPVAIAVLGRGSLLARQLQGLGPVLWEAF